MKAILATGFGASLTLLALTAGATPRALPFTYPYATLPEGGLEVEQYVDMSVTRAASSSSPDPQLLNLYRLQTEVEYGISDRLEFAVYVQVVPRPGPEYNLQFASNFLDGNAIKQRLRLRLAEAGDWPVDVSLYGELTEAEHEIEIEAKVNLERDFGPLQLMANLWMEREYYYDNHAETVFNPTVGASVQVSPLFHPGVEYWMRAEVPDTRNPNGRPFDAGPNQYIGPAVMLDFGKLWWSVGGYYRLNDTSRDTQTGETYSHIWFRTVFGLNL